MMNTRVFLALVGLCLAPAAGVQAQDVSRVADALRHPVVPVSRVADALGRLQIDGADRESPMSRLRSPTAVDVQEPAPTQGATGDDQPPQSTHEKRDRVIAGAVVGLVVGSVVGVTLAREACLHRPVWRCAVKGGAIYGGIGMLIGAR